MAGYFSLYLVFDRAMLQKKIILQHENNKGAEQPAQTRSLADAFRIQSLRSIKTFTTCKIPAGLFTLRDFVLKLVIGVV